MTVRSSDLPMLRLRTAIIGIAALLASPVLAETPLERGAYLVNTIGACGNCHTPKGARGVPIADKEMAGGFKFDEKPFTAYAPNITPDPETGIGKWTEQQIIDAIRVGKRPDGSTIGPPMPVALYRNIAEDDVKAIIAYLRALKPVVNKVPKSVYRIPLPPSYGPVTTAKTMSRADKVAYGAYLTGPIGHCAECHSTPNARGQADLHNMLGGGGRTFRGPWGEVAASNITPTNLKSWSDVDIKTAITTGVRPDGRRLKGPMAFGFYKNISDSDLDAIVAYLRTLPPK
jgi:mono/diheme cytochrome c family protein